jgi:hypothetical protein
MRSPFSCPAAGTWNGASQPCQARCLPFPFNATMLIPVPFSVRSGTTCAYKVAPGNKSRSYPRFWMRSGQEVDHQAAKRARRLAPAVQTEMNGEHGRLRADLLTVGVVAGVGSKCLCTIPGGRASVRATAKSSSDGVSPSRNHARPHSCRTPSPAAQGGRGQRSS